MPAADRGGYGRRARVQIYIRGRTFQDVGAAVVAAAAAAAAAAATAAVAAAAAVSAGVAAGAAAGAASASASGATGVTTAGVIGSWTCRSRTKFSVPST